jgi:hypothetical protein
MVTQSRTDRSRRHEQEDSQSKAREDLRLTGLENQSLRNQRQPEVNNSVPHSQQQVQQSLAASLASADFGHQMINAIRDATSSVAGHGGGQRSTQLHESYPV